MCAFVCVLVSFPYGVMERSVICVCGFGFYWVILTRFQKLTDLVLHCLIGSPMHIKLNGAIQLEY